MVQKNGLYKKNLSGQSIGVSRFILPYDVYERHRKVASLIAGGYSILDVGGELGHLSSFVRDAKIVVANLDSGDVVITKDKLPFLENSFDIVCAIDVLEHIPKDARQKFITNLFKVAKKKVVLSFPIGTKKHIIQERKLKDYLEKKGFSIKYILEHVKYGLPTKSEILKLTKNYEISLLFSGNVGVNEFLFKLFLFDPNLRLIRKIVFFLKLISNAVFNFVLYIILSNKEYSENVNRAYLVILKKN